MKKTLTTTILLMCLAGMFPAKAQIGRSIQPVRLIDLQNHSTAIPNLGKKVLALLYIDPDVYSQTNGLARSLRKKSFPKSKFGVVGVVNASDTWIPMDIMQSRLSQQMSSSAASMILFDKDHSLSRSWALGKCNDMAVVLVVGKDSKVKYQKAVRSREDCKSEMPAIIKVIDAAIKE